MQLDQNGTQRSAGGSSGGSAVAVMTNQCDAAIGTDTGGSVRLPAAYTGVIGFKPSYGQISRFGVVAYANSLDTVGILAKEMRTIYQLFHILSKHDERDPTSLQLATRRRVRRRPNVNKPYRIGVPKEYNIRELATPVRVAWQRTLEQLQENGHQLREVSLPSTKQALSAYYVLAPAEASSNLAKYDGVRYGMREMYDDSQNSIYSGLYSSTRGSGLGPEVRRRILLGSYTLSASAIDNYFIQAQRVRRLIQQEFDSVFAMPNPLHSNYGPPDDGVDFLVCPTAPTLAPTLDSVRSSTPVNEYMNDVFTVPASLAGLPAISIPVKAEDEQSRPANVGMQIIGQFRDDYRVLDLAQELQESSLPRQREPGGYVTPSEQLLKQFLP